MQSETVKPREEPLMGQTAHTSANGSPHAPAGLTAPGAAGAHGSASTPRVSVAFTFYRLRPEAFSLPAEERQRLAEEFEYVVRQATDYLGLLRTYSLVGLRGDADLLLWQASDEPDGLQQFVAQLRRSGLYPYLEVDHQH